jgi:hypothetical protein
MTFEVILGGDRAEALDEESALCAARTLLSDNRILVSAYRLSRNDLIVTRDGIYDGRLTQVARKVQT